MKPSELKKIYIASVHLYGFIHSLELYDLLDHYQISYKKEQIINDLNSRVDKLTREYVVYKAKKNYFIISDPYIGDDEALQLAKDKGDKPFFYPKTYEEFLKYESANYMDAKCLESFNDLYRFIKSNFHEANNREDVLVMLAYDALKHENLTEAIQQLELFGFQVKDERVLEKYVEVLQKVSNDIRLPANNGFTPNEMRKMMGPIDLNRVQLTLGPNIKNSILNGDIDPYQYLSEIESIDMPIMAKNSLKKELVSLIDEINKMGKA